LQKKRGKGELRNIASTKKDVHFCRSELFCLSFVIFALFDIDKNYAKERALQILSSSLFERW
jgi:uncharacterized membrane protein YsdA (DUF1294 family)